MNWWTKISSRISSEEIWQPYCGQLEVWWRTTANVRPQTRHATPTPQPRHTTFWSIVWCHREESSLAAASHTHTHARTHARMNARTHARTHTHTHTHPFNGPLSRTTWVSRYQKDKTNLDFTGARVSEWQWHQLGRMRQHLAPDI